MTDLEKMDGKPRPAACRRTSTRRSSMNMAGCGSTATASPTLLTENVYAQLMGTKRAPRAQRLDMYAYLLAAKTEFWRAHRQYAGIVHFVYLTCSYPGVYTADHFRDVTQLEAGPGLRRLHGRGVQAAGGVFQLLPADASGRRQPQFKVMLVNDYAHPVQGKLLLTLENEKGQSVARAEAEFAMPALGDQLYGNPAGHSERHGENAYSKPPPSPRATSALPSATAG